MSLLSSVPVSLGIPIAVTQILGPSLVQNRSVIPQGGSPYRADNPPRHRDSQNYPIWLHRRSHSRRIQFTRSREEVPTDTGTFVQTTAAAREPDASRPWNANPNCAYPMAAAVRPMTVHA